MNKKIIYDNWKSISPFEKIGVIATLVGLFAALYSGYLYIQNLTQDTPITLTVFKQKVHLGDNEQAKMGGASTPFIQSPGSEKAIHLLEYDKANKNFISANGFPAEVQSILAYYGRQYIKTNLSAYRHIVAMDAGQYEENYPGSSVLIDRHTRLVWKENLGDFYHQKAVVGITKTLNIFQYLKEKGFDPSKTKIKKAIFWLHGIHSGKRLNQSDNVELIVNGKIYRVDFKSNNVREEEFVKIQIEPEVLNKNQTNTNRFTIIVLPYQEEYPIPPVEFTQYPKLGPAHFRDIEIWEGILDLVID